MPPTMAWQPHRHRHEPSMGLSPLLVQEHDWQERYKPASPEEPLDERFVEALHMTETIEHLTDCVAFGTPQQKADAATQLRSGSDLLMLEERTDRLALAKCA